MTKDDLLPTLRGFTIDPPGARDLDDALWLENEVLTVCIPDVATAISPHYPVAQTAFARGYTRYFNNGNAPMLPRALSEDRLSLLPDGPRRVIAITMRVSDAAEAENVEVRRAILQSEGQLAYSDATRILAEPDHPHAALRPALILLTELSRRLAHKRRQRGELAFANVQAGWASDEEGQTRKLHAWESNIGFLIVQEMMILANRTLAAWCVRENVPVLYRNHRASIAAPPGEELRADLENAILHPRYFDLETLNARLQLVAQRARYGPRAEGHFGLNLPAYGHFTSPLRRYADFVNLQVLAARLETLSGKPDAAPLYDSIELERIGAHLYDLVIQEKEAKNERYKARAEATALQRVEHASAQRLAMLSDAEALQTLEAAAPRPEPSETLAEAVRQRIRNDNVSSKELFHLLFVQEKTGEGWAILREAALAHVAERPPEAISLLAMSVNLRDWPATKYHYHLNGLAYGCVAGIAIGSDSYETPVYWAASKKKAQQAAAVTLCYLLCGFPAPSPPATPAASLAAPAKADPVASTKADSAEPLTKMRTAGEAIREQAEGGEPVNALNMYCFRSQRRKPKYVFRQVKTETGQAWQCEGRLTWGTEIHEATATASLKRQAKNVVARQLLEAALQCDTPAQSAEATPL